MNPYRVATTLLLAIAAGTAMAANRPANYVTICNEGKVCTVPASSTVAFGRSDQFFYKVLSGNFICSEATFGGRIAGGVNECSVPKQTCSSASAPGCSSSSSSSTSSSTSSSGSSTSSSSSSSSGGYRMVCDTGEVKAGYTLCATNGGTCSFTGTRTVIGSQRYTVYQGNFFTHLGGESSGTFTDGVQCTNPPLFYITGGQGQPCGRCFYSNTTVTQ